MDMSSLQSLLTGYNGQQQPTSVAPAAAPTDPTNPLSKLAGLFNGQTDLGSYAQKVGMGMANMSNAGGDPYLAFAQGLGGTAKFTTQQQADAAAARQKEIENAMAMNKQVIDQGQFDKRMSQDQSQFDQSLGQRQTQADAEQARYDQEWVVKQAAEKRAQMLADQQVKKSAAEIERMAKNMGLDSRDMLEIEKIAQAAAENIVNPAERARVTDETRNRLLQQLTGGKAPGAGPGLNANVDGSTGMPAVGAVVNGYRFKGGDPKNADSWESQ